MRSVLLFLLLPTLALLQSPAQSSTPRPEDLGTVTGHITCSDTQRPARLAQVSLIATKTPPGYNPSIKSPSRKREVRALSIPTSQAATYSPASLPASTI